MTSRLRVKVSAAVTTHNRAMSDVGVEHDVGWATVHRILVATATTLGAPTLTTMLGIDETRSRSVRWLCTGTTWSRSNPWMTSFVDLDLSRPGGILGLTAGRSGSSVAEWIALQSNEFRAGIVVVAIDPSAPYAAGIRKALPDARIAVDHFHLVLLSNTMLTQVRQRAAREAHARRGVSGDPAWAHRRLLLRAGEHLSAKALARLVAALEIDDPTNEVGAAWAVKELLRQLLQAHGPTRYSRHETAHRRTRFLAACITADMPETTRLALTVMKWWPEIETFLELGVTNARTEGHNRVIKQIKRVACGFRNQANYERRIMLHSAAIKAA